MKILSETQKQRIKAKFYESWKSCENETRQQINNTMASSQQPMMFVLTEVMRKTGVLAEIEYRYDGDISKILNELDLRCATCGKKLNPHTEVGKYLGNDEFWHSFGELVETKRLSLENSPRKYRPKNKRIEEYKKSHISAPKNNRVKRRELLIASIDDSPQVVKMMKQIVGRQGYKFIGIQDPLQVLPTLISHNPDLIFLDIEMPIFNGYEICHQIRNVSKLKNKPVVMLSSNSNLQSKWRAKMAGSTDFVEKPIEVEKIVATLEKYLPNQRTPRYLEREKQLNTGLTWQV